MPYASVFPDLAEHRSRIVYLLTRDCRTLHFWRRTRWPGARPPVRSTRSWRDAGRVWEPDATSAYEPTPSLDENEARAEDARDESAFVVVSDADLRDLLARLRGLHAQSDLIEWALSRHDDDAGETCAAAAIKDALQALIDDVQALRD